MAYMTVTNTLVNGNTADAGELNTNFSDVIAATSDGTKDMNINALTCAGAVAFNGNMTLGNATSDTVTFTARVASNFLPSADDTYDLGSSSLQWKQLYSDDITINATTLVTDSANSFIGVNTATPKANIDVNGNIRSIGQGVSPASGTGLELAYVSTKGRVFAYDRDTLTWKDLDLGGGNAILSLSDSAGTITADGIIVANDGIKPSSSSTTLDFVEENGSYAAATSGFNPETTVSISYSRIGKLVTITVPAFNGTSNSNVLRLTIPVNIRVSSGTSGASSIQQTIDNTSTYNTGLVYQTSSFLDFRKDSAGNTWTASGTKGISRATTLSYVIP